MKLRLLMRPDCDRACPGCCNRAWDLNALPVCTDYSPYSEVMITGGEPMLDYKAAAVLARAIRAQNPTAPIFMYTARTAPAHELGWVLSNLDGVTVTLHEPKDVEPFMAFSKYARLWKLGKKRTLRVNVFKPIRLPADEYLSDWIVKDQMEWIVNCPLPQDEVLMRTDHGITPDVLSNGINWTGKR